MKEKLISSFYLLKLIWQVASKDKGLLVFAVAELLLSVIIFALTYLGLTHFYPSVWESLDLFLTEPTLVSFPFYLLIIFLGFSFSMFVLSHIFDAYAITLALSKVRNKNESFTKVNTTIKQQAKPLLIFSSLSSSIGLILLATEENVSWMGGVGTKLASGSWNLASAFALPLIIDKKADDAYEATKLSFGFLTKSFGENIIIRGVNTTLLSLLFLIVLSTGALGSIAALVYGNTLVLWLVLTFTLASFLTLVIFNIVIKAVTTALLYEYVVNGNNELVAYKAVFQSMITEKKAKRIFTH